MNQSRHALVVGGTGMLRDASLKLARDGWLVSMIARSREDMESMASQAARERTGAGGDLHPLPLDYRDSSALCAAIRNTTARHGPIALVVAWIHSTAPEAPRLIAETVAESSTAFRFVHVVGIEAAEPSRSEVGREPWMSRIAGMRYQRVILGFMFQRGGQTRWLTNDEICGGIERAIADEEPESIVGVIEPWEHHPPLSS